MKEKDKKLITEYTDAESQPVDEIGDGVLAENATEPSENPHEAGEPADARNDAASSQTTQESAAANEDGAQPPSPKKKRVMRVIGNVFLVVVIAVGILSLFGIVQEIGPDSGGSFVDVTRRVDPWFCILLIAVVVCGMTLDVVKFGIICKTVTGKFRFGASAKTNFLGKYYDAVTPFATGGQPMQIYYLNTKGISGGNSSAIVLIRYIFSIVCWIILGGALMIAGAAQGVLNGVSGGSILKIAGWIGIGVNLIVPTFVILFLVLPRVMTKITVGVVKLGQKIKLVKDVDKTTARATKVVHDFKNSFRLMATAPGMFIMLILVCFAESALTFAVPYFVMKAFSCSVDGMALTIMSLNAFAVFGVSFVPTPGNSGVMEGMGALAFLTAAGSTLIWSVLTWRFATYYVYIVIGLVITVYDIVKKNLKSKKDKTNSGLAERK